MTKGASTGIHRNRRFFGLLWDTVSRVLTSPHYALRESVEALRAIDKTQERMLAPVNHFDLRAAVSRVETPIRFFQGRPGAGPHPGVGARVRARLRAPTRKAARVFQ